MEVKAEGCGRSSCRIRKMRDRIFLEGFEEAEITTVSRQQDRFGRNRDHPTHVAETIQTIYFKGQVCKITTIIIEESMTPIPLTCPGGIIRHIDDQLFSKLVQDDCKQVWYNMVFLFDGDDYYCYSICMPVIMF
eukprot:TRINITY_DN8278_c0_g1_i3.p2 TRINITY_DN8278_c0_g1~~TRINITY_DN8278_c0_g1_i3.p2  ORF type:complete len:134 (+),score=7.34 TRINITY_DN8278_c0_g1_i3:291-692(+)